MTWMGLALLLMGLAAPQSNRLTIDYRQRGNVVEWSGGTQIKVPTGPHILRAKVGGRLVGGPVKFCWRRVRDGALVGTQGTFNGCDSGTVSVSPTLVEISGPVVLELVVWGEYEKFMMHPSMTYGLMEATNDPR
jgi:hypothetical protein